MRAPFEGITNNIYKLRKFAKLGRHTSRGRVMRVFKLEQRRANR